MKGFFRYTSFWIGFKVGCLNIKILITIKLTCLEIYKLARNWTSIIQKSGKTSQFCSSNHPKVRIQWKSIARANSKKFQLARVEKLQIGQQSLDELEESRFLMISSAWIVVSVRLHFQWTIWQTKYWEKIYFNAN